VRFDEHRDITFRCNQAMFVITNTGRNTASINRTLTYKIGRLCGLVVSYRTGGPGSIPGTTRFSEGKKKEIKQ
jgi:hypothetical protein